MRNNSSTCSSKNERFSIHNTLFIINNPVLAIITAMIIGGAINAQSATVMTASMPATGDSLTAISHNIVIDTVNPDTTANNQTDYTINLQELVVVSHAPKTKLRNGAMITRIEGTPLETVGTAEDMLARIPGLIRRGNDLQVIGKGTPLFYINGRKIEDTAELSRLRSEDIREVEVITNPSASWAATASSVVRIRTRRARGEGLSGSFTLTDAQALQSGNNNLNTSLSLNYRHNAMDIFGAANLQNNYLDDYHSLIQQYVYTPSVTHSQQGTISASERNTRSYLSLGMNWQPNDSCSAGFKFERGISLHNHFSSGMHEDVFQNGRLTDRMSTLSDYDSSMPDSYMANAYYNGRINGWGIDLNADWYLTAENKTNTINETALASSSSLTAFSANRNILLASKLVIDHALGHGTIRFGGEISSLRRHTSYHIDGTSAINADKAHVVESDYAAFAEYSTPIPHLGMLNLGMRYEHVAFDYDNLTDGSRSVHRVSNEFFPTASLATRIGLTQIMLSYGIRTVRPTYHSLRSEIDYVSRFTLQTGNPLLTNEWSHNIDLSMRWRWMSMMLSYAHITDAIYDWTTPYDDKGAVIIGMVNFSEPINRLGAFINLSPTVGPWTTSTTIGIEKQWLSFCLDDPRTATGRRNVSMSKPMFIFNSNNTFTLPHRWQAELNSEFYSKAHFRNARIMNNFWNLTAVIQKQCLRDKSLTIRLSVSDIFNTAHHGASIDLGNYYLYESKVNSGQRTLYAYQRLNLSARYTFNTSASKYKGTGAGKTQRDRM